MKRITGWFVAGAMLAWTGTAVGAGGAQDRLAQPLQPEDEQQRADEQPQGLDRQGADRRAPGGGDHGEQEEGGTDDPQRPPFPLECVHVLELPDHHERRHDLDQRVEPEPRQRNGPRRNYRNQNKHRADRVPGQRRVLQPQTTTTKKLKPRLDHTTAEIIA